MLSLLHLITFHVITSGDIEYQLIFLFLGFLKKKHHNIKYSIE